MDIDTPALPDIHLLVRKAREELAGVITALTHVLASVATSSPTDGDQSATNGPQSDAPQQEKEAGAEKRSLAPVLLRFESLRKSVEEAVSVHTSIGQKAEKHETEVSAEERAALAARRDALIEEARQKNEKVKVLIDQLRALRRDIVVLLGSYYKPLSNQTRKS